MAEYDEGEYFVDSQDETEGRERYTEIRRVHTGATDEVEEEFLEEEEHVPAPRRERPRWLVWLKGIFTGDILVRKEVERVYTLMTILGVIFFASIATIFAMLNQDMRCNKLKKEVVLLKERAIRTSEACFHQTSHSAILQRLKERGIKIEDPNTQPIVLK